MLLFQILITLINYRLDGDKRSESMPDMKHRREFPIPIEKLSITFCVSMRLFMTKSRFFKDIFKCKELFAVYKI